MIKIINLAQTKTASSKIKTTTTTTTKYNNIFGYCVNWVFGILAQFSLGKGFFLCQTYICYGANMLLYLFLFGRMDTFLLGFGEGLNVIALLIVIIDMIRLYCGQTIS